MRASIPVTLLLATLTACDGEKEEEVQQASAGGSQQTGDDGEKMAQGDGTDRSKSKASKGEGDEGEKDQKDPPASPPAPPPAQQPPQAAAAAEPPPPPAPPAAAAPKAVPHCGSHIYSQNIMAIYAANCLLGLVNNMDFNQIRHYAYNNFGLDLCPVAQQNEACFFQHGQKMRPCLEAAYQAGLHFAKGPKFAASASPAACANAHAHMPGLLTSFGIPL